MIKVAQARVFIDTAWVEVVSETIKIIIQAVAAEIRSLLESALFDAQLRATARIVSIDQPIGIIVDTIRTVRRRTFPSLIPILAAIWIIQVDDTVGVVIHSVRTRRDDRAARIFRLRANRRTVIVLVIKVVKVTTGLILVVFAFITIILLLFDGGTVVPDLTVAFETLTLIVLLA